MKPADLPERLQRIKEQDGCWIWEGGLDKDGYGKAAYAGKATGAHRIVYSLLVGPIPTGHHLDHTCYQRACVNPAHLEPVTPAENTRRANRKRTHCRHGHEFTAGNTYWRHDGLIPQRGCRICRAAAAKRHREKPPRAA